MTEKLKVPTADEVRRANTAGCRARTKLANKYGLSGSVAAAIGLKGPCKSRPKRRRRR